MWPFDYFKKGVPDKPNSTTYIEPSEPQPKKPQEFFIDDEEQVTKICNLIDERRENG